MMLTAFYWGFYKAWNGTTKRHMTKSLNTTHGQNRSESCNQSLFGLFCNQASSTALRETSNSTQSSSWTCAALLTRGRTSLSSWTWRTFSLITWSQRVWSPAKLNPGLASVTWQMSELLRSPRTKCKVSSRWCQRATVAGCSDSTRLTSHSSSGHFGNSSTDLSMSSPTVSC